MATINNSITLQDRLTPVLNRVMQAMSSTMTAMERLNTATNNPRVGSAMNRARQSIQSARDALTQFNSTARETAPISDRIRNSFNGLGGGGLGTGIIVANQAIQLGQQIFGFVDSTARWADSFVNVKARLDNMNDGLQTTDELNKMILESANRSRGSYQETADMVAKLGSMAGGAFGSSAEIVAFSEVLNKGLITSGANAAGAAGAITQLTQGLASGTLRGDELNSVMEGMPVVAQAIAKYMGQVNDKGQGNIGALKGLAEQGLITADIVKNAMFAASDDINKQFENMPITWGQAMEIFKNNFGEAMQPIIERFSQFMNSGRVTAFFDAVINGIVIVANASLWLIETIQNVFGFIRDNARQIIGVLTTIGIILAAIFVAKIKGLMTAIGLWIKEAAVAVWAAMQKAKAWAIAHWQIILIAIAIGVLIGWWDQLGSVAQAVITAIIIGLVMLKLVSMGLALPFVILIGILLLVVAGFLFFQDTAITVLGVIVGGIFWLGAVFANVGIAILNAMIFVAESVMNVWNMAIYFIQMAVWTFKLLVLTVFQAIGNIALSVAEFFMNVWNDAVYGIQMAFYKFQQSVLKIMSTVASAAQGIVNTILGGINTLINGAIGGLNFLIKMANKIPDVNISTIGEVDLKTKGDWSANIADLANSIEEPTKPSEANLGRLDLSQYAGEAPTLPENVNLGRIEYLNTGAAYDMGNEIGQNLGKSAVDGLNNLKNEAGNLINSFNPTDETGEQDFVGLLDGVGQATPFDESMLGGGNGTNGGNGGKVNGGKLDEVGKIGEEIAISDTDLKYLKDISQAEYINKFTTLTPNMTVNISDVKETADVNALAEQMEEMYVSAIHGALFST